MKTVRSLKFKQLHSFLERLNMTSSYHTVRLFVVLAGLTLLLALAFTVRFTN